MSGGGGRRWLPGLGAAVAVAGAIAVYSRRDAPEQSFGSLDVGRGGVDATPSPTPGSGPVDREAVAPSTGVGVPHRNSPAATVAPTAAEVDAALAAHAREAGPRWRQAAGILVHSDQAHLPALADAMAARMNEAAAGLPPGRRQELVVEERQLINHLRQRYAGFAPLMTELDALDASLEALENVGATPVASPPPRR